MTEPQLKFKVVQRGSRVYWFLSSAQTKFSYLPDSGDGYFHWSTCRPETGDWTECVKEYSEKQSVSIADLLLGRGREPVPVRPEEVCDFTMSSATVKPWEPSPEGAEKRQLASAIREAVSDRLANWGVLREAVCNDFSVHDPNVWCVVDVVRTGGKSDRVLVFTELTKPVDGRYHVYRIEEATEYSKPNVDKVLRRPYKLWP